LRRAEIDRRGCRQSIEVYRDGAINVQAQGIIKVAPVFNEGDIGRNLKLDWVSHHFL
jgi:hypothetical protein